MTGDLDISIILPAFNEEPNIEEAVENARQVATRLCRRYEVIVVNDGSTDNTAELVEKLRASDPNVVLLHHSQNRGYGEALKSGFEAAQYDLVFFTDADNQFDLNELEGFLPWIRKVDVVAGYRLNRQDRPVRRISAKGWNVLVRALFYVPVRDIDCAFKLFRRSVFKELDLASVGAMVNTELMVKLGRSGASVVEVGVTHYPRTAGQARGATPKVILRAFYELARMYRHLQAQGPGTAQLGRQHHRPAG